MVDKIIAFRDNTAMQAIVFTPAAARQWLKLSAAVRRRIDAKVMGYAANGAGDVKRLKGRAGCRLRVGDWRVIFLEDATTMTIVAVGNRRDIYD